MAAAKLGLEDLEVGQVFVSAGREVGADAIVRFAREFDPQLFHLDDAAASTTLFGGLAASGWHTAAITMRLIVDSMPLAGGVIGSGGELLWPKPVRPGDVLTVEAEILEVVPSHSKPDRGSVKVRYITRNQHGETVQSFTPNLVVMRRASSDP